MNIEQIKQDHENGVSVSKETYMKLVEAALLMQNTLCEIARGEFPLPAFAAADAIIEVRAL